MRLKLGWLLPNTFFLHGTSGDIMAIENMANKLGIDIDTEKIDFDTEKVNFNDYDILYIGVGQISSFEVAKKDFFDDKNLMLREFIESGKIFIAVGTTVSMFGNKITRSSGEMIDGLGILPVHAEEGGQIYGDDIWMDCNYGTSKFEIFGSQIAMQDIFCDDEIKPFGNLKYGYGDSGRTNHEGFIIKNAFFTSVLGPLFVLNPRLTREVLIAAVKMRSVHSKYAKESEELFKNVQSEELDFRLEDRSATLKIKYTKKKQSNLIPVEKR